MDVEIYSIHANSDDRFPHISPLLPIACHVNINHMTIACGELQFLSCSGFQIN